MPATRLYITCPSYAMNNPADRAGIVSRAHMWANELGWEVVPSPLLERYHESGAWLPVADRVADLMVAMQYEVVWACRGGYAAIHLASAVLEIQTEQRPLLIGYSDTTVLHACWAVRNHGLAVYGSLADSIQESRRGQSMLTWLKGHDLDLSSQQEATAQVLRPGTVRAPLFAACLVVLANLCGTPAMPSLRGKILAIEDTHERPYAVDFALNQLYLSGALEGIEGLLCGSFQHENPADYGGPSMAEILASWADRLQVPTIARLPFGHIEDQFVLPCGVDLELSAHADGTWALHFFQPATNGSP